MEWTAIIIVAIVVGLPILLTLGIPVVAILGGCGVAAVSEWRKGIDRKARKQSKEEAEMVQQMFRRLGEMEKRVETLEALLIEREREGVET